MRYPKFALQIQQTGSMGMEQGGPLVPIDEHVELIFILIFKLFAQDFSVKNVVDLVTMCKVSFFIIWLSSCLFAASIES